MKAYCPNCNSTEIVGADHALVSASISDWELDDGAPRPIWGGDSEVHWDTQEPVDANKPFCCVDCNKSWSAGELKFEREESDEDDDAPHANTGATALTDRQREDAEDLS